MCMCVSKMRPKKSWSSTFSRFRRRRRRIFTKIRGDVQNVADINAKTTLAKKSGWLPITAQIGGVFARKRSHADFLLIESSQFTWWSNIRIRNFQAITFFRVTKSAPITGIFRHHDGFPDFGDYWIINKLLFTLQMTVHSPYGDQVHWCW